MKALVRLFAAIGVLYVLVSVTPVTTWGARALAGPWNEGHGDVLIVLGGDYLSDGSIGLHSYWRALYAARRWKQGGIGRIALSGAQVGPAMRDFLASQGVPRDAMIVEPESHSTRENALAMARLLSPRPPRVLLMTSDLHMFRAVRAFRKAGLEVDALPIPDVSKEAATWTGRWPAFLELASETAKIGYYEVRRWL